MGVEVFGNAANTTVTSGGLDAPLSGTSETWTVSSLGTFPAANGSASPPTQLHATDIAANTELLEVTNMSGAGNLTWTVTRGAEGTTPVPHQGGFTIYQVTSAGWLGDAASQVTANTFTADQYFKSGRPWFDVIAFGADPSGAADSTAAFNACIAAITGPAAPASNTRTAAGPMYLPAGTYKVSSDLIIRSVSGFVMLGAGIGQCVIKATGTGFTQAVLFIDGSVDGVFQGFAVQGDGTEQVTDGIRLDWTTAASRSTNANCFRDIRVRTLNFVTGISLEGNGTREVDDTDFHNVTVTGGQTPGSSWTTSGNWQKAFAIGNGGNGNNYDHHGYGVCAYSCYYGFYVDASSFAAFGAECAANAIDWWIEPYAGCTVENYQGQNAGQMVVSPAGASINPCSFRDCLFKPYTNVSYTNLPWISVGTQYGNWLFENIVYGFGYAISQAPVIDLGSSDYNALFTLINVSQPSPPSTGIVPGSSSSVICINYQDTTAGIGNVHAIVYPMYSVNAGILWKQGTFAGRTDSSGTSTTSGSVTVGDTSAVTGDLHQLITGTGIPASTIVSAVSAGTGYTISQPATATGTPALTIGGRPAANIYGEGFYYATDTPALYRSNGSAWTQITT